MENELQICVVCREIETPVVFNIRLSPVPICTNCAASIYLQEGRWLADNQSPLNCRERKTTAHNTRKPKR